MTTDTTIRSQNLMRLAENEIENARTIYLQAYDRYTKQRTIVNRNEMYSAYEMLTNIKGQYAAARKALIQKRVIDRQ